jgi:hypothetical protein
MDTRYLFFNAQMPVVAVEEKDQNGQRRAAAYALIRVTRKDKRWENEPLIGFYSVQVTPQTAPVGQVERPEMIKRAYRATVQHIRAEGGKPGDYDLDLGNTLSIRERTVTDLVAPEALDYDHEVVWPETADDYL